VIVDIATIGLAHAHFFVHQTDMEKYKNAWN